MSTEQQAFLSPLRYPESCPFPQPSALSPRYFLYAVCTAGRMAVAIGSSVSSICDRSLRRKSIARMTCFEPTCVKEPHPTISS
jgi:hypothetical protein